MQHDNGPYALSLIICDAIERDRPEDPGVYRGVKNMIQVRGRPGQRGGVLSPAPRLTVEARFAAGPARGLHRFGLRIRVGTTAPHVISDREIRLVDSRQEIRLSRIWELKTLPTGPFWFEALIDDEVVLRAPFIVEIAPEAPASPQA